MPYHIHRTDNSARQVVRASRTPEKLRVIFAVPVVPTLQRAKFYTGYPVNLSRYHRMRTRGGGGYHRRTRFARSYWHRQRTRPCTTWKWAFGGLVGN